MKRAAAILLVLASALPALAQDASETENEAPEATAPADPSRFTTAPFEADLLRLLEVMGSVQFLRQLCDAAEPNVWRTRASEIITAEGDTNARRERLTAAFNRGYRAFDAYTSCTDAAVFAIDGYMREGETLSRQLLLRYGT